MNLTFAPPFALAAAAAAAAAPRVLVRASPRFLPLRSVAWGTAPTRRRAAIAAPAVATPSITRPPSPSLAAAACRGPPTMLSAAAGAGAKVGNSMMDVSKKGEFVRKASSFRDWVRADGSTRFAPAAGRYILYVWWASLRFGGGGRGRAIGRAGTTGMSNSRMGE